MVTRISTPRSGFEKQLQPFTEQHLPERMKWQHKKKEVTEALIVLSLDGSRDGCRSHGFCLHFAL